MSDTEPQSPAQASAARRDREIIRTERSILARLAQALKLADFMAILMVLATFFSAYATWRTALVTSTIFAVADRPFISVQQVAFVGNDSQHPMISVNFRNFGSIPALDTIVSVHAVVDGKVVKLPAGTMSEMDAGIVSPNVPHDFFVFVPVDQYQTITADKTHPAFHLNAV